MLIAVCYFISIKCFHTFGRILALGVASNVFIYVFMNIAMVSGLMPVVGIPLPLISYGGSVMLSIMISMGLVLNVELNYNLKNYIMLKIKNLNKSFGGLKAVNNVNLEVKKGSITGLIGPNGAGKTTLFNTIAGLYAPENGEIYLEDQNIAGLKPHELFNMGVLRTFQIAHEFSSLTVLENLMMVPGNQRGEKLIYALFGDSAFKKQEEEIRAKAIEVIEFLNLKHLTQEVAGNLSGGQKKLLELGRTMMVEANLVLLDEVGAGVNRTLLNEISDAILRLNKERNYTFFVIEHDMDLIEKICDPVIVMAEGAVLFEGEFNKVKSNEEVIEAYLGKGIKIKMISLEGKN